MINNFFFFEKPIELPEKQRTETASWKVKTFRTYVKLNIWTDIYESELIIYKNKEDYSKRRDTMLIWMEFLKENKKILNLDFANKTHELL